VTKLAFNANFYDKIEFSKISRPTVGEVIISVFFEKIFFAKKRALCRFKKLLILGIVESTPWAVPQKTLISHPEILSKID